MKDSIAAPVERAAKNYEDLGKMILTLNLGSSSLKFSLFVADGRPSEADQVFAKSVSTADLDDAAILETIATEVKEHEVGAIGHRLVFGGDDCVQPQAADDALLARLENYIPLFPLHLPRELQLIRAARTRFAGVAQVACFDTAFHAAMPQLAKRLPIPRKLWNAGLRRYGFHGLSFEYVVEHLGAELRPRTIVAHLGSGSSLVALQDGAPVDTTMGFSPLGGLMMGTRTGDLDPGVLVSLMRGGYDAESINKLLEEESGLLGVSEISADVAVLLGRARHDERAAEALDLFIYTVRKYIGALTAVLSGLDLLVFTGGIGEHAASIREAVVHGLPFPKPLVRVIPTNENLVVARHTYELLRKGQPDGGTAYRTGG